jgi:hypothetical protein
MRLTGGATSVAELEIPWVEVRGIPLLAKDARNGAPGLELPGNTPFCSLNFHRFISSDVHMALPLIPKWEYWN